MSEVDRPQRAFDPAHRASDADRARLVDALDEHVVAGRLSTEEFEQRIADAYAARTLGELDALRRDLPTTDRQLAAVHRERRSHLTRRMIQETGGSAALFVVCAGIWVANGAVGAFWPAFVLIIVALSLVRNAWGLYGPSPDLDAVEAQLDRRRRRRLGHDRRRDRHPGHRHRHR